jgi:hypothetical protein
MPGGLAVAIGGMLPKIGQLGKVGTQRLQCASHAERTNGSSCKARSVSPGPRDTVKDVDTITSADCQLKNSPLKSHLSISYTIQARHGAGKPQCLMFISVLLASCGC